jgi:hypothetical protein
MLLTKQKVAWGLLCVCAATTIVTAKTAWSLDSFESILTGLGLLTLSAAFLALKITGRRLVPILLVCTILLVSQWWFVKNLIVTLYGRFAGFV